MNTINLLTLLSRLRLRIKNHAPVLQRFSEWEELEEEMKEMEELSRREILVETQKSDDTKRLDWLEKDPYKRAKEMQTWFPLVPCCPGPGTVRAAIDRAMNPPQIRALISHCCGASPRGSTHSIREGSVMGHCAQCGEPCEFYREGEEQSPPANPEA